MERVERLPTPYTSWHKLKLYPDGLKRYSIKVGPSLRAVEKQRKLTSLLHYLCNAERSARRIRGVVEDIILCNDFKYFVTLTFTSDVNVVSNRHDDEVTRKLFQKWRKYIRGKYPDMFYVAIPEYHKKGALHFHIPVGGISSDDLGLVYAQDVECMGQMIPCYNVTSWKYGFSTATLVQSKDACRQYILKYITKGGADPRFFRKKRFMCSENVVRPHLIEFDDGADETFNPFEFADDFGLNIKYFDHEHQSYKYELSAPQKK